jgi:hypothetical protein
VSEKRSGWPLDAVASKFLAVSSGWDFFEPPPDHYYWLLFSRPRLADRPPQGVVYLRPHVWRKRGIGKESHLVSNVDAVIKAIVVKLERRLS